jgi:hypothetical protein
MSLKSFKQITRYKGIFVHFRAFMYNGILVTAFLHSLHSLSFFLSFSLRSYTDTMIYKNIFKKISIITQYDISWVSWCSSRHHLFLSLIPSIMDIKVRNYQGDMDTSTFQFVIKRTSLYWYSTPILLIRILMLISLSSSITDFKMRLCFVYV